MTLTTLTQRYSNARDEYSLVEISPMLIFKLVIIVNIGQVV